MKYHLYRESTREYVGGFNTMQEIADFAGCSSHQSVSQHLDGKIHSVKGYVVLPERDDEKAAKAIGFGRLKATQIFKEL